MRGAKLLSLMVCVFCFSSCLEEKALETIAEDQETDLPTLRVELEEASTNLKACRSDHECSVVGIDPRPCGGTDNFLILSENSNGDGEYQPIAPSDDYLTLINRIELYNNRVKQEQNSSGMMGTCLWISAPVARCNTSSSQCEAVE